MVGERLGYLTLFLRTETGALTNAGRIQSNGIDIMTSNNSWPRVCDWNNDGRKDLLVGQEGIGLPCNVFVYLNQGADSAPVFADSTPILVNGIPINSYRCAPVAQDLDLDGRKDLVLGEWYSSVRFYRNVGTDSNPVFTGFVNLVPPDPDSFLNGNPPRLCFADWDGDTRQDMITCDYYGSVFLRRNITPTGVDERWPVAGGRCPVIGWGPNPVTDEARFDIALERPGPVRVSVFGADGRVIATPFQGSARAGNLRVTWRPDALVPTGVYLVSIRVGATCRTRQIQVLR